MDARDPDALARWHSERSAAAVLICHNWREASTGVEGMRRDKYLACAHAAAVEALFHAEAAKTIRQLRTVAPTPSPFGRRLAALVAEAVGRMRPGVAAQFVSLGEIIADPAGGQP